jgi:L-lysine 2,3-aminomutase
MERASAPPVVPPVAGPLARALRGGVKAEEWMDWKWQLRHAFEDPYEICQVLGLESPTADLSQVVDEFVVRVTPYYLNLLCTAQQSHGLHEVRKVARTFLPSPEEVLGGGIPVVDGMG